MRKLELLAPAKNLECGLAAITHGADAVYIGATKFGARAAAGNSVEDIKALCDFAHQYGARVYVTVNTIIYEDELADTQQLLVDLSRIGVDALLVQEMGTLAMRKMALDEVVCAPMLHASTQCDTRTADKVQWLRNLGFSRAVLARELSLQEIRKIHQAVPDMELEVFVHGALCVSYSGVCYASQQCFGHSAHRGECAQFCRMKFDLLDADGKTIEEGRHFLSLKEMCQIDNLETLAEAGACSFKIEGRLKDVGYVKNVVSAFSQKVDKLIQKYPDKYCRASFGSVHHLFEPNLKKTFNRGFTSYFLDGRQPDIASFDTPKALGEYVGKVKEMRPDSFNVAGMATFANGDGLCFINAKHELEGFRVNRVMGNRLFPFRMPKDLKPNTALYRNNDEAFSKVLAGNTAERKMPVSMQLGLTADGFSLSMAFRHADGQEIIARTAMVFEHQQAKNPQADNIRKQLQKLGNTPYVCQEIAINDDASQCFLPSSLLAELRRQTVELLSEKILAQHAHTILNEQAQSAEQAASANAKVWQPEYQKYSYLYNVSNHLAHDFYAAHGLKHIGSAMEVENGKRENMLMQCRHCIRYTMGFCVRHGGQKPTWREPLALRLGDGRKFRLEFNCAECQMNVYSEK